MTTLHALLFTHAATTGPVTVRVRPSFLPDQSDTAARRFVWSYHVRIENGGKTPVQLITRHWIITDARGVSQEVEGAGVVGEQPVIAPGEAFDYVSGCPLATSSGRMHGSYGMIDAAGKRFDAAIPPFPLESPHTPARRAT